mmetsp:Transcript_19491/g.39453  ORF Transcript_19491/g.39453 Transcript_19491/m.39453 type:complete len:335 (+) Transcript_19491:1712-2716(+)
MYLDNPALAYLESCLTHLDDMVGRYLPPSLVRIVADYAPPRLLAVGTSINSADASCPLEGENVADDECANVMAHAHPRSASLLLLLFVALLILLAMIIATCILLIRLLLAERRVRHAETDKLLDRTTSGFHLGSLFGRSASSTAAAQTAASDDAPDILNNEKDNANEDEDELNATPGHLHALHGRNSPAVLLVGRTSSSNSLRQRTNSTGGGGATDSLNSSIHSINEDILLDKCGMEDLVPPPHPPSPSSSSDNQKETMSSSLSRLNTVSERMSEETLDDCHAFTDVSKMTRRTESFDARANEVEEHGALECVRECDDDDDDDETPLTLDSSTR